jgi:translation initiation factor IF-2
MNNTRLSSIAKEYNIGITTIIEFMKKKGYDVEPNPNSRLNEEQILILKKEYANGPKDVSQIKK